MMEGEAKNKLQAKGKRKKSEQDEQIRKTKEWEGRVFGEEKSWRARVRDSKRFNISFCVALSP